MQSLFILALALQVSPDSIPQQKLVTSSGDEVKCRLVWHVHSRIPERVCRTVKHWAKFERDTEEDIRQAAKNTGSCSPNGLTFNC